MATSTPKPLLFAILCGFALLFLYHRSSSPPSMSSTTESTAAWSSNLAGWRKRATAVADGSLHPSEDKLVFAAIYSTPVDPAGFTLALFEPDTAVDAAGHVLTLLREDFDGLKALAHAVARLPETGEFQNQWRVKWPMTSRPIDRVLVKTPEGIKETSVYGWAKGHTELEEKVGDVEVLPAPLYEFVGVAREGREGVDEHGRENKALVQQVKKLLGDAL